jgi:hypothetical protein
MKVPQTLCEVCEIAKFKKFAIPPSLKLSRDELKYTITMDYKQFNIRSQRGNKYFTLILHVATSFLFVILAKSKSEMAKQIINLNKTHLNRCNIELKRIHSDSDTIYKSKTVRNFASENNIILTLSS